MSADQEWSEAIKASIKNAEEAPSSPIMARQETQADQLPTSSQSPSNSPQPSPDSQQKDLPPTPVQSSTSQPQQQQQNPPTINERSDTQQINVHQDQHVSQSGMPSPNVQVSCNNTSNKSEVESQQPQNSVPPPSPSKADNTRRNEANISSSCSRPATPQHAQALTQRSAQQNASGNWSNIHMDPNMLVPTPLVPARQTMQHQQQPRPSTPQKSNQQKPPFSAGASQNPQGMRMSSPPRPQNIQPMRPNIQRPSFSPQPGSGGQFQQPRQPQPQQPLQHQQQRRPVGTASPNIVGANLNKKMAPSGMNTQQVRCPPVSSQGQLRAPSPGQTQGSFSQSATQKQIPKLSANVNQGTGHSPANRMGNVSQMHRMPPQQGQPETFPNSQQKRQNNTNAERRFPPGPSIQQLSFDDEAMFDDFDDDEDDDDDYDEDMDVGDMEGMDYSEYGAQDYGYPSSDSDELSEEESALLEELRDCEDDERYDQIISRLQEKGVDPEEIDEMMYHSNNPHGVYPGEDYDENEGEEAVSSSSMHQMSFQQNQHRPQPRPGMPTASPNKFGSGSWSGQNSKGPTGPNVQNQQGVLPVPSSGNSQQGMSSSGNVQGSTAGTQFSGAPTQQGVNAQGLSSSPNQQTKTSQVLQLQPQHSMSNRPVQTGGQNQQPQLQAQQQLKLLGPTSQSKKVFQSSGDKLNQTGTQMTGSWQPLQNIVRGQGQSQIRPGDSRQPIPKATSQPPQLQVQGQRPVSLTKPGQPMPPSSGQPGAPRQPGQSINNSSGVVVRPVQYFTIMTNNNNQSSGTGQQQSQNPQLVVRPGAFTPQMVISSVSSNQQPGTSGTPVQGQPQMTRPIRPRAPLQLPQRPGTKVPQGMQSMGQQTGQRTIRPVGQNLQQQSMRGTVETAPSEASQARLNVLLMQQSLDQEIMAKKGMQSTHGNSAIVNQIVQPRANFPGVHSNRSQRPQHPPQFQQNQTFPSYQPKHTLPPRQPIPTISDPNLNLNSQQALSGGRPVCSVIPFTNQTRGSGTTTNVQRLNVPTQNTNFVRPRNPVAASPNVANTSQHLPTMHPPQGNIVPPTQQNVIAAAGQGNPQSKRGIAIAGPASSVQTQAVPSSQPHEQSQQHQMSQHQQPQQQQQQQSQQQQQNTSQISGTKGETFSLDRLSEDKCIITGKGKSQGLMVNMVYQIRSPFDHSLIYALWNGERFEDVNPTDFKALALAGQIATQVVTPAPSCTKPQEPQKTTGQTPTSSDKEKSKALPQGSVGGTSKFQAEFLHSLARRQEDEEESWSDEDSNPPSMIGQDEDDESGQVAETNQQKSSGDAGSSQTTYVKPLTQGKQQKEEPMEEETDDSVFKKPFNENEDYFRVCNHCGYTSKNFHICEGCKRAFQGPVKTHVQKKNPPKTGAVATSSSSSSSSPGPKSRDNSAKGKDPMSQIMENVSFYGNGNGRGRGRAARGGSGRTRGGGLKGRVGTRGGEGDEYDSSDSDESSVNGKRTSNGSGSSTEGQPKRRVARPKSKNPTPRKRSKKMDEPVTLTISSDEDEPSSTSNNFPGQAPSPAHSAGSESPIFPSTPMEPVGAFGRFRRARMEDEDGNSKLSTKIQQRVTTPPVERPEDEEEEDDDDDGEEPPIYEIDIRSVRIGSMRTQPEGPLLIDLRGVCFKVRSERTEEAFECEILAQDVEHVKYCSGQTQPVLFLFLTQECGEKLRSICRMEPGDDEYFDPSSTDMKQKMVVIIIESFNYMPQEMLRETLSLWADVLQTDDESFIEELTEENANDLLIQSAPAVLTADVERDVVKFKRRYLRDAVEVLGVHRGPGSPSDSTDNEPDSTSSSPPEIRHHFMGTSVRLLLYPPPPARGLPITTEDLFCLTEGEFLNDVIIDFYLQYLYQEKLSEENKRRTHIFSSFFYKRLTQRDRHSEKTEEDAKKSLPERRHARVKKWTKTVDLFSKDFIIVPINEHSHWYLAVICFPGLAGPEEVPFIPSNHHKSEIEDESPSDAPAGEENGPSEETTNQEPGPRTILGQQLDSKKCLENDDGKYCLGKKQPCILMFDSLAGPSRNPNVRMLREYLQCEWNAKKSEQRQIAKILRGSSPKVPQQSNYSDCGVYLLQYVESFFEDPIADFQVPMKGLQSWFPEEVVHNKRQYIHELIMSLHQQYQAERGERALEINFEPHPREPPPMKMNPLLEQNSRPEDGISLGMMNRDDENSNSNTSLSGEMSRAELASEAPASMAMEEDSLPDPSVDQPEDQQEENEEKQEESEPAPETAAADA